MKRARWLTLTLTLTLPLIAAVLLAGCNWRQQAAQVVKSAATPLASPSPTATPLPPPPTPTPDLRPRHIVQPGDTAWAIAARYGLTIAQLSAANRLFDASALAVGAELVIPITPTPTATPTPDPAATPTPTATADPAAAPSSTLPPPPATPTATPTPTPDLRVLYTVQSGDSLWAIAARFGITIAELIAANALGDESAILSIDQVLLIPLTPTPTATPSFRTATPTPTLTPIPTATPTPVPFTPPAMRSPADLADWPRYLADLINERRFAHGLPPLIWSPLLAEIAQAHAADCLARESCGHTGGDGATLGQRLQRGGYAASWAGENWVYARYPELALEWWYDEPPGADPHRRNLLSPNYTEIGIGAARNQWGMVYFIADLARPASE